MYNAVAGVVLGLKRPKNPGIFNNRYKVHKKIVVKSDGQVNINCVSKIKKKQNE